jgi:DNA adenine methylase
MQIRDSSPQNGSQSAIQSAIRNPPSAITRPLLKWAGGKRQLLPELRRFYPTTFARYVEPFFGSGAVFFDLYASGRLAGRDAVLIDANADLIGCYEAVRDAPVAVGDELDRLAASHARAARAHYYAIRDEVFNPERDRRRAADGRIAYTPQLAAMFIYLNRTGFNGLFRVNARGAFNVPAGRYERPRIADRDKLTRVAAALSAPGVELRWGSFESTREFARAGDFLYFDPPYAPLTTTANFTAYTAGGFGANDQAALQRLVILLARRGCHIVLSNSTASAVSALYDRNSDARRAGLRAHRIRARRAINSVPSQRGPVYEYLIVHAASA